MIAPMLENKKILIAGLANKHSIAAGIAKAMHAQGAELAFTYQNEKLKNRVFGFAESWGSNMVYPCDVTNDQEINDLFSRLGEKWPELDAKQL